MFRPIALVHHKTVKNDAIIVCHVILLKIIKTGSHHLLVQPQIRLPLHPCGITSGVSLPVPLTSESSRARLQYYHSLSCEDLYLSCLFWSLVISCLIHLSS